MTSTAPSSSLIGQEVGIRRKQPPLEPERTTPLNDNNNDVEDWHPPVSPPNAAEELFLTGDLRTDTVSAAALSQQLHQHHTSLFTVLSAGLSIGQDDFDTARQEHSNHADFSSDAQLSSFDKDDPFEKDALKFTPAKSTNSSVTNLSYTYFDSPSPAENNMTDTSTTNSTIHVDAAEKVYETAKNVWGWGKGVMVLSPFLGLAEGVAGKVVGLAGTSLEDIDHQIVPQLHSVDDNILNPAIQACVSTILGVVGKTEDIFKPIVMTIVSPVLSLLPKSSDDAPAASSSTSSATTPVKTTETPELTSPTVSQLKPVY